MPYIKDDSYHWISNSGLNLKIPRNVNKHAKYLRHSSFALTVVV
jgi:hypothetical protein